MRGKADVWRWFGLKKRKTDGHIEQNIAVCFDCCVSVKLAGGTSNLQTHIRRHHPLKQAVRSKSVVQAEASTSQSTVTQVPSTSNVKTVSAENSKQTTIMAAFVALPQPNQLFLFFYLKYTLGKGKLCLQRLKKVRLLQCLGVSDVNTIKRKKQ